MKKIYVGHSRDYDFEKELYEPLRRSSLAAAVEVIFPHEQGREFFDSREGLKHVDYFVAEITRPSTGLGIEMGWASLYGTPIIAMHRKGSRVSGSAKMVADRVLEYGDTADLIKQLEAIFKT